MMALRLWASVLALILVLCVVLAPAIAQKAKDGSASKPDDPMSRMMTMMEQMQDQMKRMHDETKLLGIVTDRDIRLNLPSPATSLSVWEINYLLARMTVDSVMTKAVVAVDPHRDARGAAQLMLDHKIGALPVVDGGTLIGIITETDLLRAFVKAS